MKLAKEFYKREALDVAKDLLGKILVREKDGKVIKGKIVEVEAYIGPDDKGAHTYKNKRTKRTEAMFGEAGRTYIYLIYGMYNCINAVTNEIDKPEAVLIRALEPVSGLSTMAKNRYDKDLDDLSKKQINNLTDGPGKLCMALDIDRSLNKEDLNGNKVYIEYPEVKEDFTILRSKRIGIDYAEEAIDYLWRFYIKDNKYVSVKNKYSEEV